FSLQYHRWKSVDGSCTTYREGPTLISNATYGSGWIFQIPPIPRQTREDLNNPPASAGGIPIVVLLCSRLRLNLTFCVIENIRARQMNEAKNDSQKLVRSLSLLDATMIVIGSMIGSGIFIVSAKSAAIVGAPGWLLAAWAIAGVLTITGALCCAELAAMMPRAGGQYVFLREAYGPATGVLFGWSLFFVVQTGTIAAVAVAFA